MKKIILIVICFLFLGKIAAALYQRMPEEKMSEKNSESSSLPLETTAQQEIKTQELETTTQQEIKTQESETASPNQAEEKIVTAEDSLPVFTSVDRQKVTIESKPEPITYTIYRQGGINESKELDSYVSWHGCATCSTATILTAFTGKTVFPAELAETIEKEVFGEEVWENNYEKSLEKQMPLSLYGVSRILEYYDVKQEYVRAFKDKAAARQITKHLGAGKPVILISSSINRSKKKHSGSTGYHTTILLGLTDTGKVVIADPAGGSRITYSTVDALLPYMFPCKDVESTGCYFNGRERSGGYILVEPQ